MQRYIFGTVVCLAMTIGICVVSAAPIHKHMSQGLECDTCHYDYSTSKVPSVSICQNCHPLSDLVARMPKGYNKNPHEAKSGAVCYDCHAMHLFKNR